MCRRYVKQSEKLGAARKRDAEICVCVCVWTGTLKMSAKRLTRMYLRLNNRELDRERTMRLSRQLIREVWCRGHLRRVWQSKLGEVLGGQQPAEEEDVTPNWKAWVKKTANNAREVVMSQSAAVVALAGLSEGWNRGVKRREGPEGAGA